MVGLIIVDPPSSCLRFRYVGIEREIMSQSLFSYPIGVLWGAVYIANKTAEGSENCR
jgi:hypothetical protein